ncbi:MAG: DUF434 domain-containing protein [Alkalispirochaetaceae bacterium]
MSAEGENLDRLGPAIRDYRLFLERGYPESTIKKVVGDRHRLSGAERLVLYRGVSSSQEDRRRSAKRLPATAVRGAELRVDFYNVGFTLLNHRLGRLLFRSTDGYIRDAGAVHGRLGKEERLSWILEPLLKTLAEPRPEKVYCYLDSPVSHSRAHAGEVALRAESYGVEVRAEVVSSADYPLKQAREGVIATGDSAVIDAASVGVVDLSAEVLSRVFGYEPPALGSLLEAGER